MRAVRLSIPFVALFLAFSAPAQAKSIPPQFDPVLSLRGNCTESLIDPVKDPSCPYLPPPNGPRPFERTTGVAVDPFGNEYIASMGTLDPGADERIDVFDDEGKFITEFSLDPSKTNAFVTSIAVDGKGNVYTFHANNEGAVQLYSPTEYDPEAGAIAYSDPPVTVATGSIAGALAVDVSNDHLFVVREGTVTEYASAEGGNGIVESFTPPGIGFAALTLAVDAQGGRLFLSGCRKAEEECFVGVLGLDAPHPMLGEVDGSSTPAGKFVTSAGKLPVAVDEDTGRFFVADPGASAVYEFEADLGYRSQLNSNSLMRDGRIAISNAENTSGDAFNRHRLFVTTFDNHRVFAFAPTSLVTPDVDLAVSSVAQNEATLEAEIDPGGAVTEYTFELTTQAAFESEGFTGAQIAGEGTVAATSQPKVVSAPVGGLAPGTAYRYRVLAINEAGPAEPTPEASFVTYDDATGSDECPNQNLRTGASAALADCRAYELVTPPDTSGRAPRGYSTFSSVSFPGVLSSPIGNAVSFIIQGGSLPESSGVGSINGEMYRATRGQSGWSTALAGPSGEEITQMLPGSTSPDQGYAVWGALGEGPLFIEGPSYVAYLHYPDGHSEPIGRGSEGIEPLAVAKLITKGATHVVFNSRNLGLGKAVKLEPNAPPNGIEAVYDRTIDPVTGAEQTHVVSLLPGGVTPSQNSFYQGASEDGNGIAFTIGDKLYLRKGNAITYEIGEDVEFAGVSEGGELIFYLEKGDLKAFDASTQTTIDFSQSGDVTPVNVAAAGTRAYLVSPSVLAGANPRGELPVDGEQNLYLSTEGQIGFVGTVTDRDVEGKSGFDGLGLWTGTLSLQPARDPSRSTPDGSVLLFQSRGNLTGYDPNGAPQVYRYDSEAARLDCVSCLPTGAAAGEGAAIQSYPYSGSPTSSAPLEANVLLPALTSDGRRIFFESTEALVSTDTDGRRDVYEWEDGGVGSCTRAAGCVYLISSGHSANDDYLYGQSADGDDVFFASGDRLVGEDTSATSSIYDARVGGGFASSTIAGECLGEACQPALSPPGDPIPVLREKGNPKPERCRKPKRKVRIKGKTRCLKPKHRSKRHRKATKHKRAPR